MHMSLASDQTPTRFKIRKEFRRTDPKDVPPFVIGSSYDKSMQKSMAGFTTYIDRDVRSLGNLKSTIRTAEVGLLKNW
jgi:hypothetical protein